jgi:transposase
MYKPYLLSQVYRCQFIAHYDQRSNVETTFSMIKRKFGRVALRVVEGRSG